MPKDSCSSISHIFRLDYCNSILINLPDTTLHLYTMYYPPQCYTTRQMFEAKGSHQPSSSATPLASHQSSNFIQNLCPHVQLPFRVISALNVILGHAVHKAGSSLCSSAKGDYVTQRMSSSFGRRAFVVAGSSEWNNLTVSLRHAPSIGSFKTKLKTHPLHICYG